MLRTVAAIVVGLVAWIAVATVLNFGLRAGIAGYHEAEPTFAFTLPMMIGRLALALIASLVAGAAIRSIAEQSRHAPLIAGLLTTALFLPVHIQIGARLPLWYHLFFLLTIVPMFLLGARMRRSA